MLEGLGHHEDDIRNFWMGKGKGSRGRSVAPLLGASGAMSEELLFWLLKMVAMRSAELREFRTEAELVTAISKESFVSCLKFVYIYKLQCRRLSVEPGHQYRLMSSLNEGSVPTVPHSTLCLSSSSFVSFLLSCSSLLFLGFHCLFFHPLLFFSLR